MYRKPEYALELAGRLSQSKKRARYTIAEIAEKSDLSLMTIRHYLAGRREPVGSVLIRLAEVLNVSPQWLLTGVAVEAYESPESSGTSIVSPQPETDYKPSLPERIEYALCRFGNPREVAEEVGLGRTKIYNIIAGDRRPSLLDLSKVAVFGRVSLDWLISGEGSIHMPLNGVDE